MYFYRSGGRNFEANKSQAVNISNLRNFGEKKVIYQTYLEKVRGAFTQMIFENYLQLVFSLTISKAEKRINEQPQDNILYDMCYISVNKI